MKKKRDKMSLPKSTRLDIRKFEIYIVDPNCFKPNLYDFKNLRKRII